MVRLEINGIPFNNPIGWEGTTVEINFDHANQITSALYNQEYTLEGSAYAYLYAKYTASDFDKNVAELYFYDRRVVIGALFISACLFNETQRTVKVKIEDDGYSASIVNNLSIDVVLDGVLSKNSVAIAPVPVVLMFMIDNATGAELPVKPVYKVVDTLRWFIDWLTDASVGFRSDYFDSGAGKWLYCTSGLNLRAATNQTPATAPKANFREFFNALRALENIGLGFERVDGMPIARVEHISFFRSNPNSILLDGVDEVVLDFVQELLYSKVIVGSQTTNELECDAGNTLCTAFVDVSYYGYDRESFGLTGVSNLDIALDLSLPDSLKIDSNTIEDIVQYGATSFDEDVIFIERDSTNTYPSYPLPKAAASDPLNIGAYWYNGNYTNQQVLLRYQDYLSGALGGYTLAVNLNLMLCGGSAPIGRLVGVGYTQTVAQAPLWTTYPAVGEVVFANDTAFIQNTASILPKLAAGFQSFDSGGQYNDTTGHYTAQYEGVYRFNCQFTLLVTSGTPLGTTSYRISILKWDAGGTLIQTVSSPAVGNLTISLTALSATILFDSGFIAADAGNYFTVGLEANTTSPFPPQLRFVDAWLEVVGTRSVVSTFQNNTGNKRAAVRRKFNYPLSDTQIDKIVAEPTTKIRIRSTDVDRIGFIESATINFETGFTEFSIITED